MAQYKVITLCGSTRFKDEFLKEYLNDNKKFVSTNCGCEDLDCYCPCECSDDEECDCWKIAEKFDERTLYIAHKTNKYCSNAMHEFMNIAKDSFKIADS